LYCPEADFNLLISSYPIKRVKCFISQSATVGIFQIRKVAFEQIITFSQSPCRVFSVRVNVVAPSDAENDPDIINQNECSTFANLTSDQLHH